MFLSSPGKRRPRRSGSNVLMPVAEQGPIFRWLVPNNAVWALGNSYPENMIGTSIFLQGDHCKLPTHYSYLICVFVVLNHHQNNWWLMNSSILRASHQHHGMNIYKVIVANKTSWLHQRNIICLICHVKPSCHEHCYKNKKEYTVQSPSYHTAEANKMNTLLIVGAFHKYSSE